MTQALKKYDNDKRAKIAMLCWSIRKARNALVWNQKHAQVNAVTSSAMQYLVQWKHAQLCTIKNLFLVEEEGDGAISWVAPYLDKIKISVDASVFEEKRAYRLGIVERDHNGLLIQAKTVCKRGGVCKTRNCRGVGCKRGVE